MDIGTQLSVENAIFFVTATGFLILTERAWRNLESFQLPKPLPSWFPLWFGGVQLLGGVPPLLALGWGIWQGIPTVWTVWTAYFIMLALQILTEALTLRKNQSVVWVMVPYLYVPYRLWQLYEGLSVIEGQGLDWMEILLIGEMGVWSINYLLDLAQLPRLLRWPGTTTK